jgi:transposase
VNQQTPKGKELHVIVDNYATHKHEKVKNWLKRNKRVTLHFIPTSSSWLNLAERFFGLITEKQIRRGVFSSVSDFEKKIMQFIEVHFVCSVYLLRGQWLEAKNHLEESA